VSSQNDSVCYVKAAFPLLGKILERTEFKENSSNAKKMQMVRRMYSRIDENVDPCIREEDDEERQVRQPLLRGVPDLRGVGPSPQPWAKWGVRSVLGWGCGQELGVEWRWGRGAMGGVQPCPGSSVVPRDGDTGCPARSWSRC